MCANAEIKILNDTDYTYGTTMLFLVFLLHTTNAGNNHNKEFIAMCYYDLQENDNVAKSLRILLYWYRLVYIVQVN